MSNRIVFILGAGTSREAGLPDGEQLKDHIEKILNFDSPDHHFKEDTKELLNALALESKIASENHVDLNGFRAACARIRRAIPSEPSIDTYINKNPNGEIELCSKLAIVSAILRAECDSKEFKTEDNYHSRIDFRNFSDTWFFQFANLLFDTEKDLLPERLQTITLIIFNYDRCVEHYLLHKLVTSYGIETEEAADILRNLGIYHPYGAVGQLPWSKGNESVDFGKVVGGEKLLGIARQIKTFSERIEGADDSLSEIFKIRNAVATADRLVFLGFAFHKMNLKLLMPKSRATRGQRIACLATAFQRSQFEIDSIENDMHRFMDGNREGKTKAVDLCCKKFFDAFGGEILSSLA